MIKRITKIDCDGRQHTAYAVECNGCGEWAGPSTHSMTEAVLASFQEGFWCSEEDDDHRCPRCTPSVAELVQRRLERLGVG
jgi:hypothetical protein